MGVKDLIFVVGQHGLLTAFDGLTGAVVWKTPVGNCSVPSPTT